MSAADFARRSRSVVGIMESIGMARTSSVVNIACLALHQSIVPSRVADNVGGQDRRQFALLTGHGNFPRLCTDRRRPRAARQLNGKPVAAGSSLRGGLSGSGLADRFDFPLRVRQACRNALISGVAPMVNALDQPGIGGQGRVVGITQGWKPLDLM